MGADLYIKKQPRNKQITGFQTSLEAGYFRDSYNNSSFLWQFDLSWWTDIIPTLQDGEITIVQAKVLLKELKKREPIFEKNMQDLLTYKNRVWDYKQNEGANIYSPDERLTESDRIEWVKSYRERYHAFTDFLRKAIKLKSGIEASL